MANLRVTCTCGAIYEVIETNRRRPGLRVSARLHDAAVLLSRAHQ